MSTLDNIYDSVEQIILTEGLRISAIDFHKDQDLMLVVLNTGKALQIPISQYSSLAIATLDALQDYRLIGNGVGVHWPQLDEDLSLKGMLKDVLKRQVA